MRSLSIITRGLLWGTAIGAVVSALYGILVLGVLGPGWEWSPVGVLGVIYGAPAGAALGLLMGGLTAGAVANGSLGRSTIHDMTRTLLMLCIIAAALGVVTAVAVSRSAGDFFEALWVVTVPAAIAWFVGRAAIPRFAERYVATGDG